MNCTLPRHTQEYQALFRHLLRQTSSNYKHCYIVHTLLLDFWLCTRVILQKVMYRVYSSPSSKSKNSKIFFYLYSTSCLINYCSPKYTNEPPMATDAARTNTKDPQNIVEQHHFGKRMAQKDATLGLITKPNTGNTFSFLFKGHF